MGGQNYLARLLVVAEAYTLEFHVRIGSQFARSAPTAFEAGLGSAFGDRPYFGRLAVGAILLSHAVGIVEVPYLHARSLAGALGDVFPYLVVVEGGFFGWGEGGGGMGDGGCHFLPILVGFYVVGEILAGG